MNYAAVVAGGKGSRMGKSELPKQFLMLGDKPIIVHTIEQFLISEWIDYVVVAVPQNWLTYMRDIMRKYFNNQDNLFVTSGGSNRNETILNICEFIKHKFDYDENDIIVTHDAVRPFLTQRIIKDNVECMQKYDAANTVIPAIDTIVEAKDGKTVSNIPIRDYLYQGQTPQTFKIKELVDTYHSLTVAEQEILTDAAKIYVIKNKTVKLVQGEVYNIKVTTPHDYRLANLMVNAKEWEND